LIFDIIIALSACVLHLFNKCHFTGQGSSQTSRRCKCYSSYDWPFSYV